MSDKHDRVESALQSLRECDWPGESSNLELENKLMQAFESNRSTSFVSRHRVLLPALAVLLAGSAGATLAFRMRKTRMVTRNPEDPPAAESIVRWHRRLGRTAVVSALLGFVSAGFVLAGMYSRQ